MFCMFLLKFFVGFVWNGPSKKIKQFRGLHGLPEPHHTVRSPARVDKRCGICNNQGFLVYRACYDSSSWSLPPCDLGWNRTQPFKKKRKKKRKECGLRLPCRLLHACSSDIFQRQKQTAKKSFSIVYFKSITAGHLIYCLRNSLFFVKFVHHSVGRLAECMVHRWCPSYQKLVPLFGARKATKPGSSIYISIYITEGLLSF